MTDKAATSKSGTSKTVGKAKTEAAGKAGKTADSKPAKQAAAKSATKPAAQKTTKPTTKPEAKSVAKSVTKPTNKSVANASSTSTTKPTSAKPAAAKSVASKAVASKPAAGKKTAAKATPAVSPLAQALIDAQTRFWMHKLSVGQIERLIREEWDEIYAALESICLRDAFEESKVKDIVHRYALEMDVSGAIMELAGEIATLVFMSPKNRKTRLVDVLSDRTFDELLEKTFESGGLLDRSTARMRESQAFRELLSELVVTVLKGSLTGDSGWLGRGGMKRGARALKDWIGERAPDLTESLEESARRWVDGGVGSTVDLVISLLEHDRYRDTAMAGVSQWWDRVKEQPVSSVRSYISNEDLQEYIVVGYEFWLELRQSDYLKSFIDGGIALFYRKYGDDSLQHLITEMGLDEDVLKASVLHHAADVAQILVKTDFAEGFFRRQLTRFYQSEEAASILAVNP